VEESSYFLVTDLLSSGINLKQVSAYVFDNDITQGFFSVKLQFLEENIAV
jgi:hypothetical protein